MNTIEHVPPERNFKKDKQIFIETVNTICIEEIPTLFNETSVDQLRQNIELTKIFLLGEMHGVKENVDVIYTLFKKFGFRQLALEWRPELKEVAEKFLETGEIDFDVIKDSPDGRITAGHFALLKKLKSEGLLDNLVCFDRSMAGGSWNDRDAHMAQNILQSHAGLLTLVVAGNFHTKVEPLTFDNEAGEQHPMGENIKKVIPDVSSGRIEFISGTWHNFGTHEIESTSLIEATVQATFHQGADGLYVYELPVAHAAIVPNPDERLP